MKTRKVMNFLGYEEGTGFPRFETVYVPVKRIRKLHQDVYGRWIWSIIDKDGDSTTYYTDHDGDGLWNDESEKQVTGTCQFSLAGCTYQKAYRLILKYFGIE